MNRLRTILLIAGVLLAAAAIAGVAQPRLGRGATPSPGTEITVTGNGTVDATPDQASFDFGVTTRGATAAEALSRNNSESQRIIDSLKSAGIDSPKIQTTQVSLWPQTSSNGNTIVGYQASNSVNVTAALDRSGVLVDAAVGAGANNVDGPNLDTADKSSLYGDALQKAIADAKQKAQAIAAGAGLTLGNLEKVSEGGNSTPPVPMFAADKAAAGSVPIEAGTQQIQASVTVTYAAS
ncbi:MAG TPA: SIMPL domain-containing protein [Gaiellaceae bacterium]|nr:SIMPL domain-containing protein [Gaiellaceae bacterium]